jgi:RNA polymerase sigma factor (sigma-70 family)
MPFPNAMVLKAQTDDRLVALARAGHEQAFETIVERHRRTLVRICRRVLGESRAEDAVQLALLAAWTALQRGDDVHELRPWLARIARNTALNQLRTSGWDHSELSDLLPGAPAPDEEAERRLAVRRTLAGVAALPERQREALLRIAVHGAGQDAVARDLGLSEGAVRQLVHRARVHLREIATALTPMPLAGWAAAAAPGGVAVTAAKVGAVVVIAGGGAAAGPSILHHQHGKAEPRASAPERQRSGPSVAAAAVVAPPVPTLVSVSRPPDEPAASEPARRRITGDRPRQAPAATPQRGHAGEDDADRGDDDRSDDERAARGDAESDGHGESDEHGGIPRSQDEDDEDRATAAEAEPEEDAEPPEAKNVDEAEDVERSEPPPAATPETDRSEEP